MKLDVYNMEGKKVDTVEVADAIFDAPVRVDLMHQAFVRQMANARLGTHQTKVRGEVSGGGRKPWRQKGTGRARQGSIRSAQWVGGGKIHTPHPRSYELAMPRKMRRAAMRSALSVKANENAIVLVDELKVSEAKTKIMAKSMNALVGDASALVLVPEKEAYADVLRSARNLPDVMTSLVSYLSIRDLLRYDKIVIPVAALDAISSHLG
ncbi:MAG: 50S ribosomal protein L4 [Anaerolineaceae bacterium]|nr:50S ribosomal protein L4 [Anaerolineaceae bacterium]